MNLGLDVARNYLNYANLPYSPNDGGYQPFTNAFVFGTEYDDGKYEGGHSIMTSSKIRSNPNQQSIPMLQRVRT